MSENDAWNGPVSDSHADLITAKATKKRSDGDGTDIVGSIETGAIGVTKSTPKKKTTTKSAPKKEKEVTIAVHSTRNVVWEGVGKIAKGYNILKEAEAEKWLTRNHVREATPEEISREYGK
jgi:hypothetical protein